MLYLADQDADEVVELYVVPADGSHPARKLPIPLVPGGDVGFFEFGADDAHVIYTADQEEDERFELFTIPSDGSGVPQKLNAPLVPGGDVGAGEYLYSIIMLTWDRSRVLYSADQDTDELVELYSVPTDASGPPVRLCALSDRGLAVAALSHDSHWAVLLPDQGGSALVEPLSVPTDGSGPLRPLTGARIPERDSYRIQVSYDSQRVVYVADQETDEVHELFSAPIDGSAPPVKLSAPMPPGGDVNLNRRFLLPGFWVMADGVMYEADQEVDDLVELYFVAIEGGAPPRKLATAPAESPFPSYAPFQPGAPADFGQVLFRRDNALWSVSVEAAAAPVQLDQLDVTGIAGDVELMRVTASGARAIYRAREEGDRVAELYSVPTDKPSQKVALLPNLQVIDVVGAMELALDDRRLVFLAELAPSTRMQLYSLPVEGGEAPRVLGPGLGPDDSVWSFWIVPGGQAVFFSASLAGQLTLLVAPVDGSAPAIVLGVAAETFGEPRFDAGATRVVYRQTTGLYAVPLDGSSPPVRVNETHRRAEADFQVTPDGSQVVYRSLAGTQRSELFVTASDGSALPRRVSDAMPVRGDLTRFALSTDGTRAVYRADPSVDERFELFSVPLDGSSPPVRLHPGFAANRDVEAFAIAPDDRRVVYTSDARVDGQIELFSVPLDGSAPPVRLSVDLGTGDGVGGDFQISSDSRRVVYRVGGWSILENALFSTPIQGGRGGVELSRGLPSGSVVSFELSADASTVAFTAIREFFSTTLLAAPIGGGEKATELAGPFLGYGSVADFALSADGSRFVWRADQDSPGVIELYTAAYGLGRPVKQR